MGTLLIHESAGFLLEETDREKQTVKQVIIKAGDSKNNRRYGADVLKNAVPLFEGTRTYANHPSKADLRDRPERDVREITGWINNVKFDESLNAIVGERHFTQNQAGRDVWRLVEQIIDGQAPASLIGASINALGRAIKKDDGMMEVESITSVYSVDDVTTPAAGGGFDKLVASDNQLVHDIFQTMTYSEWFEARSDYTKRLQTEMKKVRQSEAIKAARKREIHAIAEADRLKSSLQTLREELKSAKADHEATRLELDRVRRELLIVETLQKVQLPAEWKDALRATLQEAKPEQWDGLIQAEIAKARRSNALKVPVALAPTSVPVSAYVQESRAVNLLPLPYEDADTWAKRISQIRK